MRCCIVHIIFVFLGANFFTLSAQNSPLISSIVSEILEEYQNTNDIPLNGEELFNDLYAIANNPIPINATDKETLEKLPFLSDFQIENILYYVYTSGPLFSLYELKAIQGLNDKTIRWLLPFIRLNKVKTETSVSKIYANHEFLFRYVHTPEIAEGYKGGSGTTYLGDRNALLVRLDGSISNGISYHLLTDKDKGEKSYTDFLGGSIQYEGKGILNQVILGDYKIRAGQGLLSWSGSILGKSMEPDLVRKKGQILSIYKSSMEYGFYRGGAVHLSKKNVHLTLWGSKRNADATLDSTQNGNVIRTILTSGYHNTQNTVDKKGNIELISGGGNLQFNNRWFRPGFTLLYNHLNLPLIPNSDLSYIHIQPRDNWIQYSTDFFTSVKNMHFWGELAYQSGDNFAGILGTTLYPADALQASLIYRNYSPGFYSIYGNGFGETSTTRNEKGLFLGLKVFPTDKITVSSSFDIYRFPWLRYQQSFTSEGFESFLKINFQHSKEQISYIQLRYEKREKTVNQKESPLATIQNEHRSGVRINYNAILGNGWEINSRAELSMYALKDFSSGILLMQDISYKPESSIITGNVRFAWFNTDNYDARIYAYEKDVLYAFSVPPYFGKGIRTYFNVKFSPIKNFDFWLRFARLNYFDRSTIGTGIDEINANHKSEIKVQARMKF